MKCRNKKIPCQILKCFPKFARIQFAKLLVLALVQQFHSFFRLIWKFVWHLKNECIEWQDFASKQSVPVVVFRFTTLIDDIVICRHQINEFSCSWWSFVSAFSVRNFLWGFWPKRRNSVLREVSENEMLLRIQCYFRRVIGIRVLRNVCWRKDFCVIFICMKHMRTMLCDMR